MSTDQIVPPTSPTCAVTSMKEAIEAVTRQAARALRAAGQPQEWKLISLRECRTPTEMQLCDTPERAVAYWRQHIGTHPFFNPDCECMVTIMVNTRRRIRGHCFVSTGTMDTLLVHPREVFRLAVIAGAAAIVVAHNLCVAAHKLCYVERRLMWRDASVVPMSTGLKGDRTATGSPPPRPGST